MLLFAGLLIGALFLEGQAKEWENVANAARERGEDPVFDAEQRASQKFWLLYWFVSMLVFLVIVVLAAVDVLAIRRTARRLRKQLQDERRDMIAEQLARIRAAQDGASPRTNNGIGP
jgi:heme/copper-type cytochrome/quinol oxidase subunit 3